MTNTSTIKRNITNAATLIAGATLLAVAGYSPLNAGPTTDQRQVWTATFKAGIEGTGDASYDQNGVRADWSAQPGRRSALPGDTEIWNNNGGECPDLIPVITEDGHHVTLKEWLSANGVAHAMCVPGGAQFQFKFNHLIPGGLYTLWVNTGVGTGYAVTDEGLWDFSNLPAGGALGIGDGSDNAFRADAHGQAEISVFQPAGPFSMFGYMPECLFGEVPGDQPGQTLDITQIIIILALHLDGETHGGMPHSPDNGCTAVFQGGFIFNR